MGASMRWGEDEDIFRAGVFVKPSTREAEDVTKSRPRYVHPLRK